MEIEQVFAWKKAVTKKKINLFLNVSQLIVHIELPKTGKIFMCEIHFNVSTLWNFLHGSLS